MNKRFKKVLQLGALVGALALPVKSTATDFFNVLSEIYDTNEVPLHGANFYGAHMNGYTEGDDVPDDVHANFGESPSPYTKIVAYTDTAAGTLSEDYRGIDSLTDYLVKIKYLSDNQDFNGRSQVKFNFHDWWSPYPEGINSNMFYWGEFILPVGFSTNGVEKVDKKAMLSNLDTNRDVYFNLDGIHAEHNDDFARFNIYRTWNSWYFQQPSDGSVAVSNTSTSFSVTNTQRFAYDTMTNSTFNVKVDANEGRHLRGLEVVLQDIDTGAFTTNSLSFELDGFVASWTTNITGAAGSNLIQNIQLLSLSTIPLGEPAATNFLFGSFSNSALALVNRQDQYQFIATPGTGGTISGNTNDWLDDGVTNTLIAEPAGGYAFENWTLDGSPVSASQTNDFVVGGVMTSLVANFTHIISDQTIDFPPIGDKVTTDTFGLAATASSSLPVSFAVHSGLANLADGTNLTFTGAGMVSIVASQTGNVNWNPAPDVTNTFNVTKAVAGVTLNNLTQTYNGESRIVTATTDPLGLTVAITYDGSSTPPTDVGTYAVTGTVNAVMYQGSAIGTLTVNKADQSGITFLPASPQTYNTTNGLSASGGSGEGAWSYSIVSGDGEIVTSTNLWMRTGTGTVRVRATKAADTNYNEASSEADVNAQKGAQTIDFPNPGTQVETNVLVLSATSSSDLGVVFVVENGPAQITEGTNLSFIGAGMVSVSARQAGDDNWASAGLTNTFNVLSAGAIGVTTSELAYIAVYNGASPPAQTLVLTNSGQTAFGYSNEVNYSSDAGWFTLEPVTGQMAGFTGQVMTGTVNSAGLTAGVYVATSTITATGATNSPVVIVATLAVNKAGQTINFPAIGDKVTTNTVCLSATASSGFDVTFMVDSGPASITNGTNLSFSGAGLVSIVASQSGDDNWGAAPDVTNVFPVSLSAQAPLVFTPASPQTYNTTSTLSALGGSGSGAVSFSVQSGPGQIFGDSNLRVTSGVGNVVVVASKAADVMYNEQSVTAQVEAVKAAQTIDFPNPGTQVETNVLVLSATASSGLGVTFNVDGGPAQITSGTNLSFTGTGTVSVSANQVGDDNWDPAGLTNTFNVLAAVIDMVATPTFNPDGGAHPGSAVNVTVSCGTDEATIRYTTNGNDPTELSPTVTSGSSVSVPLPGTLKAKAWKTGMNPSAVKSANYTVLSQPPPAPLNVSASDGAYTNKITVEWTVAAGATGYQIFRNTSDNSAAAEEIGTASATTYNDTTAIIGKTYYYWVKAVNAAGASAFSAPDTGYLGVIGPLVTANNMVGDNIHISAADPVTIAVEMMNLPAAYIGHDVDWWVAAYAHAGGLWYYFDSAMNLTPFDGNPVNCRPAFAGPLYDVPPQTLVENMFLAEGTYNIWFAVDYPMDGVLNLTPGYYLMDCVTVVVE